MAGHSKWNNIKRTKGIVDKKRASLFTKLSKDITVAVKMGESGELEFNPLLKVTVDRAKAANMPNDNIQKAIDKGLGISESDAVLYENSYEFYGPFQSTFIVDCETDNPNRTLTDLKSIATKSGLKLANLGSISWQYREIGEIVIELAENELEKVDNIEIELMNIAGITDIKNRGRSLIISTEKTELKNVLDSIKSSQAISKLAVTSAGIIKQASDIITIAEGDKLKMIEENLAECNDVVNVWKNYEYV